MAHATFNIRTQLGADGQIQVSRVPLPVMPDYLKEVVEEQKS